MNYDFDTVVDRGNTGSLKYDFARAFGKPEGLIPMWIADMDFQAPDVVVADIQRAAAHGVFGYTEAGEDYYSAVAGWFSERFGYTVPNEEIIKTPGVVFALAHMIRAFTAPGEAVLVQSPVYYPFFQIIRDNARTLAVNPLKYIDGKYEIDFADFELKVKTERVKMFLLCSPHNPVGRVWTRAELAVMDEICRRYGVIVVSDEIHCDFVWQGHTHTSFRILNEDAVIATAPSKSFNLAGLQVSNNFIKNSGLRRKLTGEIEKSGLNHLNTLGIAACKSAYLNGAEWLEQLKAYIAGNIGYARAFLSRMLPDVRLVEPEGTYLLWLDFSGYHLPQAELDRRVTDGAGLWLDSGAIFGADGAGFQRINVACPRKILVQALDRLAQEFRRG